MKDQHKKIKGYRDLTQEEINAMNKCKEFAVKVGELVEEVKGIDNTDLRWLQEGEIDLQKGFMSLIRSIAKPETF